MITSAVTYNIKIPEEISS